MYVYFILTVDKNLKVPNPIEMALQQRLYD